MPRVSEMEPLSTKEQLISYHLRLPQLLACELGTALWHSWPSLLVPPFRLPPAPYGRWHSLAALEPLHLQRPRCPTQHFLSLHPSFPPPLPSSLVSVRHRRAVLLSPQLSLPLWR